MDRAERMKVKIPAGSKLERRALDLVYAGPARRIICEEPRPESEESGNSRR